jgi:RNA polymerase sigma factor for flagellar operon FliA
VAARDQQEDLRLWRAWRRQGETAAREALVTRCLPLVHWVVDRLGYLARGRADREELVSAGLVGLLRALEGYDEARGVPLAGFVVAHVRGAIRDAFRALDWLGRARRRQVREAARTLATLEAELGRTPTDAEVAARLGVSLETYHALLEDAAAMPWRTVVLARDAARAGGGRGGEEDEGGDAPITAAEAGPLDRLLAEEQARALARAVAGLAAEDQQLLYLHYVEEQPLGEIADALGVSSWVVRRRHAAILLRLRGRLAAGRPGDHLAASP